MRSLSIALLLLTLSLAPALEAQPLTDADREKLLTHLDKTREAFLAAVENLSEAQWNYRPAAGKWTIAEVAEHIASSESTIRGAAEGALKQPAPAAILAEARQDAAILKMIPDRTEKRQAPENLRPTNRFQSAAGSVAQFRRERMETMRLAREGGDLRAHAAPSPFGGHLDAYGWLLFNSTHSERHTKQIAEIKADPGFPKN